MNPSFTYQSAVSIFSNSIFNAAAFIEVADEPGGDFYDFYETPDENTSFIIGDVSGKGQIAADYMRETKKVFHAIVKDNLAPAGLINKLNDSVSATYDKLHFVTLTFLQIDTIQKQFNYIRAGHCPLLYYSAAKNECEYFEDKGIGLGIIRDNVFSAMMHEYQVNFGSNDVLVLFTDGLIEAVDELSGNTFEMKDAKNSFSKHIHQTAEEICNGILSDFRSVIHSQKSPDDLALIVIKFV